MGGKFSERRAEGAHNCRPLTVEEMHADFVQSKERTAAWWRAIMERLGIPTGADRPREEWVTVTRLVFEDAQLSAYLMGLEDGRSGG